MTLALAQQPSSELSFLRQSIFVRFNFDFEIEFSLIMPLFLLLLDLFLIFVFQAWIIFVTLSLPLNFFLIPFA